MAGSIQQALNQTNNEYSAAIAKQTKGTGSKMDKESFLMLLITQFKYQDPLNPMEDQEFIAQMSQFSSLEQLMNLNEGMTGLTSATNNQQMLNATSYIGKEVSISGNTIGKTTDGATGETKISTFRYAFGDNVSNGVLTVRDSNGNAIYTEDLAGKAAGTTFEFNWRGINNSGLPVSDGVYTVNLAAYNAKGEAVLSDQVVDAVVTGVVKDGETVFLGLDGGQLLPLADVRQVSSSKTVTANGGANAGTGDTGNNNSGSTTGGNTNSGTGTGSNPSTGA